MLPLFTITTITKFFEFFPFFLLDQPGSCAHTCAAAVVWPLTGTEIQLRLHYDCIHYCAVTTLTWSPTARFSFRNCFTKKKK